MGYFVAASFFIYALMQNHKNKTWVAPDVIYAVQWGLISLLASLQLFHLNAVRDKIWLMVFVGGFSFIIGSLVAGNMVSRGTTKLNFSQKFNFNQQQANDSILMKTEFFWLLYLIIFAIDAYYFRTAINLMQHGNVAIGDLRSAFYGNVNLAGYVRFSGGFLTFLALIRTALRQILIAYGICFSVFGEKKDYKPLLAVMVLTIITAISDGGRFILAYFLIELFVCFVLVRRKINICKRTVSKKIILFLGILTIAMGYIIVAVSEERGVSVDMIYEHLYTYICGDIPFLDAIIDFADDRPMTLGALGLYGFWSVFFPSLHYIGFPLPDFFTECHPYIDNTVITHQISATSFSNAFSTPFYYLYADFRWLGIMGGMFIFGLIAGHYFHKVQQNLSIGNVTAYVLIVQMIFKSLQQYPFVNSTYVAVLILLCAMQNLRIVLNHKWILCIKRWGNKA